MLLVKNRKVRCRRRSSRSFICLRVSFFLGALGRSASGVAPLASSPDPAGVPPTGVPPAGVGAVLVAGVEPGEDLLPGVLAAILAAIRAAPFDTVGCFSLRSARASTKAA